MKEGYGGLIFGLILMGCATTGGVTATKDQIIAEAQSIAQQVCRFLPTAATVAEILATNNPLLQTAEAIASAICVAVAPIAPKAEADFGLINVNYILAQASKPKPKPSVNGVVVHGRFTK